MIFKTFNSDIDNISSKWGLFGKSFYDVSTDIEKRWNNVSKTLQSTNDYTLQNITNAWKMGNSNPIKFLADDEVVSILDRYNKALDSGAEATAKFLNSGTGNEFMDGFLKDLDGAPATMDKYKVATKNATMAQKSFSASTIATKAAVLALNVAVSMGLSIALSALIKTISEVAQSEENLKDASRELGSELSNNASTIEDYKEKINDLKSVLSDSSSSFDDVSQAREDLMVIQDELIKKFGTEKGVIEDITEAIYGQTDALDQLSKDAYYKAVDEFNQKTSGDKFVDWLTFGSTDDDRVQSNMDKMIRQMESSIYSLETTGNEVLDNLIAKSLGLTISSDTYGDGKHFTIYGELDEIQEKLTAIREMASDFDVSTGFENNFTDISNDVNSLLEAHQNLYEQYVLWEKILTDNPNNQYDEQYNLINQSKKAYDEAIKSGDIEAIQRASEKYSKTLSSAIDLAMSNYDYDVASYFEDMYPDMQQMFSEWKFTLDFEPNTDGLKDKVSNSLIGLEGFSSEDIMAFNPNVATEEQINAYGELNNIASEYGLTLQGLINLLMQMGLIQSESYQQLVNKFGQDAVDKLTPEDLEIAYTISSEEADKALEQEKNKIKSELESLSKEGNVDLTIRPVIDSSAMQAAGWDVEDGSIATTFTQGEFIWQGDEENGQYVYVHYTPILPDGTVLTPDELTDYLYGTLEGSQSVLDADNKGIVLKVDTDLNIPEGDIKKFTNGEGSTDAIDGLIQKTGEWDDKVHGVQEQYYDTGEGIGYASNALDGLIEKHKQLENPNEITVLGVSETIDKINTNLKPTMESLSSAWQEIFTTDNDGNDVFNLDNIDLSTFESIKSELDNMSEKLGLEVDYSSYENLIKVLRDTNSTEKEVEEAFEGLATTITQASISGVEDFETLKYALGQLGVQNNEMVAFSSLISNTEALKQSGLDLAEAKYAEMASFANATVSVENYEQALNLLKIQQLMIAQNPLNTSNDINNLYMLAQAAGLATEAIKVLMTLNSSYEKLSAEGNTFAAMAVKGQMEMVKQQIINEFSNLGDDLALDWNGAFAGAADGAKSASKATEKEIDVMAELNSEMDKIQSAYKSLCDIRETFNEHGKISVDQYQELTDMGFNFLANLVDENGQLGLNANAFDELSKAKLQEMQIQMARNAIDTINGIKSEVQATEYLTYANENLRDAALASTEAMLHQAVAAAKLRGEQQGLAAEQILQGYEASKQLATKVDFFFDQNEKEKKDEKTALDIFNEERRYLEHLQKMGQINNEEFYRRLMELAEKYLAGDDEYKEDYWGVEEEVHDYLESIKKTYNWMENLLESLSKKTNALIDKAEKFINWQKKNAMINRAVKAMDNEITQNQSVYEIYMQKASSVGLSNDYIRKIQNGTLNVEEIANEELSEKIEKYTDWYEKAQSVLETINDLYDQERDLIRQKLDNVLDYYNDLDSYLSSITSKVEALISLHDSMGKRSSLTELIEQFAEASDQLTTLYSKTSEITRTRTEIDFGESDSVNKAKKEDNQKLIDSIQAEIQNLDVTQSGTYTKLLNNIAKTEAQIQKYQDKGWDVKKAKQYAKLQKKLEDYYELQAELDANATSNTIANYSKIYTAFQKLQDKIDSGKTLTKSQQKKYDSYLAQMEALKDTKDSVLSELETQLGIANGTIADDSAVKKAQQELASVQSDLESTATYQNLIRNIEKTEAKLAELDAKGYDNLTKSQKKTYDKLTATLEDYYEKKQAFDDNATADNIAQYNKIYTAWKKLQDKLDAGKNLTTDQWKKYNQYTEQLAEFETAKDALVSDLQTQLDEAMNPGDKLDTIESEYEKSAESIYNSYQKQIAGIENAVTETKQYQNLLAKAQKLEQKKDTKGLSTSEQATLDKYNAELEALRKGGTTENIADYMATWEKWYKLEQKLVKNGKLSDSDAKKYDEYTAQLKAWNEEKQTQINDLVSLMEDELEALQKTYTENVAQAESEISDYYSNLYDLAKQIAEYNLSTLEAQLSLLDSYISYYKEIVALYDSFSGDKLAKILTDLDVGLAESQEDLYAQYLSKLEEKYDATLSKINEYNELIEAIDTNDFAGSMQLFEDAIAQYNANGQTEMASKLQSVLDILDERAVDADNWSEFSDEWLNEWTSALAEAKTELISTATSIQEVNDALREIQFSNITNAIQELSSAQDIISSIVGLINDDWIYDEDGNLTQYGLTKVGLLVEEMERAKQEASKYAQLIESVNAMKDTYSSDSAYQEALQDAKINYLTSLSDLQSYQDSIVSILTQADESVINSLKEVIEKRKEALQKKKELYDYNKTIQTSQKEIDSIKAQIDALESLSGAMDAATKAKLAQLKADLAEKEEALQDTKDEHTYNLQIDALDELLDTLDSTMSEVAESVNESFATYVEAINSALDIYDANKDFLNEWSNNVLDTVAGLGTINGDTGKTDLEFSVESEPLSDEIDVPVIDGASNETAIPSFEVVDSDTVTAIESTSAETNENLSRIQGLLQSAVDNGVLVRATDTPLLTMNPEMMNLLQNYIPPIAMNVNHTIPNMIRERNVQPVINVHYDNLINVEGNIDKDFAKVLPNYLEKSYEYTTKKLYREINILR